MVNSIYLAIYLNRKGGTLRVPINLRLQWAFDAILRPRYATSEEY
jgi:hypothetical protein